MFPIPPVKAPIAYKIAQQKKTAEFFYDLADYLKSLPTLEARPVVHGEWIFKNDGAYGKRRAYCSACGKRSGIGGIESNQRKPFCPNCGANMKADMRGGKNEEAN